MLEESVLIMKPKPSFFLQLIMRLEMHLHKGRARALPSGNGMSRESYLHGLAVIVMYYSML